MKKYIATWVYLDSPEEKSNYPNTGGNSSSTEFQNVYWRCIVVFYETSLRFHENVQHLFFTNTDSLPVVDGMSIESFFKQNNIEVISLKNLYPLPENYFGSFRNQFFEFSIIDYIAKITDDQDMLLLLDSDCVFTKSLQPAFDELKATSASAMTYVVKYDKDYEFHGLNGSDMSKLFNDYGLQLEKNPFYSGGELLFAKGPFFEYVAHDFKSMYKSLIERYRKRQLKFNEEAHVLSFYYYKLNAVIGGMDSYIKRMWTNRNYYRNVKEVDLKLPIWHLPSEKRDGIYHMFQIIQAKEINIKELSQEKYFELVTSKLTKESNHKLNKIKKLKSFLYRVLLR